MSWTGTGRNTLVNFGNLRNERRTGVKPVMAANGSLFLFPNMLNEVVPSSIEPDSRGQVLMFETFTGRLVSRLTSHMDVVNALAMQPTHPMLFSGGQDGRVLAWEPPPTDEEDVAASDNRDEWSDSDSNHD